ncbi:MAG TPA: PIG-L family deacetylase [Candidatus Didemnitutus sp.]|nr:PIG-L family deacetylase [Candidatus Didemnitutus sp.]
MSVSTPGPIVAVAAHPDDIEFGCGGIVARETARGRRVIMVVCSQGEAGTNGTPNERQAEARNAAAALGAEIEFLEFDGDAHLEVRAAHAIRFAEVLRRLKPETVLAPTLEHNQHPDHWRVGQIALDAVRLARFGGLRELLSQPAHRIGRLFFYAVDAEAESTTLPMVAIDISLPTTIRAWTAAMNAHVTQMRTRNYAELQLVRARALGARIGVEYAQALYPNDPLVFDSIEAIGRGRHG